MKQIIESKNQARYGRKQTFDNTWGIQLKVILEELGYKVEMEMTDKCYGENYEYPVKINDIPILIEGVGGSILKIRGAGTYNVRRNDYTSASILVNKNINIKKFKANLDKALLEYEQLQTKRQATLNKRELYTQIITWANNATFDFTIVAKDHDSFIQYSTLRVCEKSAEQDYGVRCLTLDKQFQVVGTSLPYSMHSSFSYISFAAAADLAKYVNESRELAAKAQPFINALENFVKSIS